MERRDLASRLRWAALPATARILLPICFLLIAGLPWLFRAYWGLDDRIFISAAHGVLTHGYPFETYHTEAGRPFYDHTPLFPYLLVWAAQIDSVFGLHAAVVAGRLMTLAFAVGTIAMTYVICRDLRGPMSGAVAAVLVATNPLFVVMAWTMHMEVPMAFCVVVALWCLVEGRMLAAGLAIAAAVMLKEHALAFWLVAGAHVLLTRGWRAAAIVTAPSAIAFVVWAASAWLVDQRQFRFVLNRWINSAGGESSVNGRFRVSWPKWALTVARDTLGMPLVAIPVVAAGLALVRRAGVPRIVVLPIAYCAVAIAASFVIHLKEPRWLTAVIPMAAIAVGLLVDWGALAGWVTRYGRVHDDKPQVSAA